MLEFENNDFIKKILNGDDEDLLISSFDVKTITGRNKILNFVEQMNLELNMLGFSNSSVEIARFYDSLKARGKNSHKFYTHPVIKMILETIEDKPNLKKYIQTRILDEIQKDLIKEYNNIYNNNDKIYNDNLEKNKNFIEEQQEKEKQSAKEKSNTQDKKLDINLDNKILTQILPNHKGIKIEFPIFDDNNDNNEDNNDENKFWG